MLRGSTLGHDRREDAGPGEASPAADPALPRIAFDWLQDVLHGAFADPSPPVPPAAPVPPVSDEPDWDGHVAG